MNKITCNETIRLCAVPDGALVRVSNTDYQVYRTFDQIILRRLYRSKKGSLLGSKTYKLHYGLRCQMWVDVGVYIPPPVKIISNHVEEEVIEPGVEFIRLIGKYDNRSHEEILDQYAPIR